MRATGVILAGGKSSRMGTDKALLPISHDTMLSRAIKELQKAFAEVLIANRRDVKYGLAGIREIPDIFTGMGPLAGIHAGLCEAKYYAVFFAACDMPFIDSELARFMVEQVKGFDIAVPKIGTKLQPLFAVYTKKCIPYIEFSLEHNINRVTDFYSKVNVNFINEKSIEQFIEPDKVFCNVNTPWEYKEMAKTLSKKSTLF